MFFYCSFQQILIDGSGHLLGRLASVVAKTILQGQSINTLIVTTFYRLVNRIL